MEFRQAGAAKPAKDHHTGCRPCYLSQTCAFRVGTTIWWPSTSSWRSCCASSRLPPQMAQTAPRSSWPCVPLGVQVGSLVVTLPNPLTSLVPEVIVSHQLLGSLLSHRQGYSSNPVVGNSWRPEALPLLLCVAGTGTPAACLCSSGATTTTHPCSCFIVAARCWRRGAASQALLDLHQHWAPPEHDPGPAHQPALHLLT